MNVNGARRVPFRSSGAQLVIDRYAESATPIPKDGSNDALHSDRVHPLTASDLTRLKTVPDWLAELARAP